MKLFIDTANIAEIREINEWGVVCGVTTNPSLIAKEGRVFEEVIKELVVHEAATTAAAPVITYNPVYVFFAQNSYELTEEAKDKLDKIESGLVVEVVGSASIEGTPEYNQQLSEKRAEAVANYLQARDIDVKTWFGEGAKNEHSGRVAVINTVE